MILRSEKQIFTFWDNEGTKLVELISNIKTNRLELKLDGSLQSRAVEQEPAYKPYFDRHGNNPLKKNAEFVLGLLMKNGDYYSLSITVECRVSTWLITLFQLYNYHIYSLDIEGLDSLSEANVVY